MNASAPLLSHLPTCFDGPDPDWLASRRRRAAERLRQSGLPTTRDEAWRFTSVQPLGQLAFTPATAGRAPLAPAELQAARTRAAAELACPGTWPLLVVDGQPQLDAAGPPPAGVELLPLGAALEREPALLEPLLGALAPAEHFAALNAALFEGGLLLRVRAGQTVDTDLHLVHVAVPGSAPRVAHPRVLVLAEPGSQLRLVESYLWAEVPGAAPHLGNVVTEIAVRAAARVEHVRISAGAAGAYHIGSLAVAIERDASYTSQVVALGGALYRLDLRAALTGPGGRCQLDGVYLAGRGDHVDHQTFIDHRAPHCESSETYRGIVSGSGQAVWNGIIAVRRDAPGTRAHQENRNLLLSDDGVVHAKPHLEIETDDVSCSHGATVGTLDADQLFYLRARGIGEAEARAVLTYSFVRALLERIGNPELVHRLGEQVLRALPDGAQIRALL
jgi:Fe-S cluster assembly protein SufD